jgi:hypothetical protein
MIVVEDRLKEVLELLPEMSYTVGSTTYKPIFRYGTKKDLKTFLSKAEAHGFNPYPLIWLLYPYVEKHMTRSKRVLITDLTLILAVNTSKAMANKARIDTTFKKVLFPLYDNVFNYFRKANTISVQESVEIIKFANYSGDLYDADADKLPDRWDALKTVWNLDVNDSCLRSIKTN